MQVIRRRTDRLGEAVAWRSCSAARASGAHDQALAGLAGSSVADRFRAWRGASGRRYVFSVFRLDRGGVSEAFPDVESAVVIAAQRGDGAERRLLWVRQTGPDARAFLIGSDVAALAARGGCELHLHFLAGSPAERDAIVADLAGA